MTDFKPDFDRIEPISAERRPEKTWKHFYAPEEHWERLCTMDVVSMRQQAEDAQGVERIEFSEIVFNEKADKLLHNHHDYAYRFIYSQEILDARWGKIQDKTNRYCVVTKNSIYIIVYTNRNRHAQILTAYRAHPKGKGIDWNEDEFRKHAIWKFKKDTNVSTLKFVLDLLERVNKNTSVDAVQDLWWLALAVGYGRSISEPSEIQSSLTKAEILLTSASQKEIEKIRNALDWDHLLDRLASSLKENQPESFEDVLGDIEDYCAIATTVHSDDIENFFADAETLMSWIPADWSFVAKRSATRLNGLNQTSILSRLWSTVEDSILSSAMRNKEASIKPQSVLVDELIPVKPWSKLMYEISSVHKIKSEKLEKWVKQSLENLSVENKTNFFEAGKYGMAFSDSSKDQKESWEIFGNRMIGKQKPFYKVFLATEQFPLGKDVTQKYDEGLRLYSLREQETVLIVVVGSISPLNDFLTLQEIINASDRANIIIEQMELSSNPGAKIE